MTNRAMTTTRSRFDFESAWRELARPGFYVLPANLRELLTRTADVAGELSQLRDLSMPWPDERAPEFRLAFDKVPAEWLSQAARTVHALGHWYPGIKEADGFDFPGRLQGSHWKFAHYADQSLRARMRPAVPLDDDAIGFGLRIQDGEIVICYASPWCWLREPVGLATVEGVRWAREVTIPAMQAIRVELAAAGKRGADDHADRAFVLLKAGALRCQEDGSPATRPAWDVDSWNTDRYMVAELAR